MYNCCVVQRKEIRINIRRLVEIVLAAGSLGEMSPGAAQAGAGIKVHQQYQQRGLEGYIAEVPVQKVFCGEYVSLLITGKIDGVYTDQLGVHHLEEIKTISADPAALSVAGYPLHWAQLSLYGWFYAQDRQLSEVCLDLIYFSRPLAKEQRFSRMRGPGALAEEYLSLVQTYLHWLDRLQARWLSLCSRLRTLAFPFPDFRPTQRHFSKLIYRAIRDGKFTFLQAPTGTGKTMAALFASLKSLGEGHCEKLFFLTAKNSGAAAASQALQLVNQQQAGVNWVLITAKAKICFLLSAQEVQERPPCTAAACSYARDYYTKLPAALESIFRWHDFDKTKIEEIAQQYQICPFELSLDLALYCDVIIADYNYAFDYTASLKRFFRQGKTGFALLVDEAHNLTERAREMYSGVLNKKHLLRIRRRAAQPERKILGILNSYLLALKKAAGPGITKSSVEYPAGLAGKVGQVLDGFDALLAGNPQLSPELILYYWELTVLRQVLEQYDESYRTLVETTKRDITIRLCCIDPARQLQKVLKNQQAAVFFSATLMPAEYFLRLTAPDLCADFQAIPSPFPAANSLQIINPAVSTRWKNRERMLPLYAQIVAGLTAAIPGNLIVFSPSFGFQELLLNELQTAAPGLQACVQHPGMTRQERDDFLSCFAQPGSRAVGFCVTGGSFAESIDLAGEKLIGVIIFGVGLPQVNPYTKMVCEYFDRKFGDGYDYAFTYPGINRVLQAAGRVIRGSTDRGFVYLVDDRYATRPYRALLPAAWRVVFEPDLQAVIRGIRELLG